MTLNFDYVVYSIEESHNVDELFIDELHSSLLVHEHKMKTNYVEEQALKISTYNAITTWRGSSRGSDWG